MGKSAKIRHRRRRRVEIRRRHRLSLAQFAKILDEIIDSDPIEYDAFEYSKWFKVTPL